MQNKHQQFYDATSTSEETERLLSHYDYAELRIETTTDSSVKINDDEVKMTTGCYYGMSARVLDNGAWGFASTDRKCKPKELLKKAEKLCCLEKGKIALSETAPVKKTIRQKTTELSIEEILDKMLEAKKSMDKERIVSKRLSCSEVKIKKEFYNSEGSEIIQETGYCYTGCVAIAKYGEIIERGSEVAASRNGFSESGVFYAAEEAANKALRVLHADNCPKGRFTVILDPKLTGVFAHEAIGHASEADSVIERESILSGKKGVQIGSALVTIVDDPSAAYFGQYNYDDEGVKAKKTVLIRDGIVNGFINSRESAKRTGEKPNGHARAMDFQNVPIVRMSNTFLLQVKSSENEVFDIRHGIYLKGMKGGSVDIFSGGFMLKAEEAYKIKNGETGKALRGAALSGNILTTLKSVCCIGKDFGTSPGICGKGGQEAPVEDGGPHIKVENMMVG